MDLRKSIMMHLDPLSGAPHASTVTHFKWSYIQWGGRGESVLERGEEAFIEDRLIQGFESYLQYVKLMLSQLRIVLVACSWVLRFLLFWCSVRIVWVGGRGTVSREEERVSLKEERRLSLKIGSSQVLTAISNVSSWSLVKFGPVHGPVKL